MSTAVVVGNVNGLVVGAGAALEGGTTQVYEFERKVGITRSKTFQQKKLAAFAVNVGTKCGHGCSYCSTGALLRRHRSFKVAGRSPYEQGFAIVDPGTPERVRRDAKKIPVEERGLVELCTSADAWSPEAQRYNLGRRCLEAILAEPGWAVRILTKNAAVEDDFDLVAQYRERVQVGLSITGTPEQEAVLKVIEPYASPIAERMSAMNHAKDLGLRTYAMLCPLMRGIADGPEQVEQLVKYALEIDAEEVFVEPVNARGNGLRLVQEGLENHGFHDQAQAIGAIRKRANWSEYALRLLGEVQKHMRQHFEISRLRFLLYPSGLTPHDQEQIRQDDAGVVWLGKEE